jgi:hypothetical protein
VGDAELRPHHLKLGDGLDLAVQVGEDAYFVRDIAMGVTDDVAPALVAATASAPAAAALALPIAARSWDRKECCREARASQKKPVPPQASPPLVDGLDGLGCHGGVIYV